MKNRSHEKTGPRPLVYLIGIGMGGEDQLTGWALDCLEVSEAVMGAERMLDSVSFALGDKPVLSAYKPSEMVQWLSSFQWQEAALVLSGDTGFYSGAEAAAKAFAREGWDTQYVPGISSLSYFCARLGKSWQNVHAVSSHGRECDVVGAVKKYRTCFVLLGGQNGVPELCRQLVSGGMGTVLLSVGENFSYEDERIVSDMTPAELIMEDEAHPFGGLCCILVENSQSEEGQLYPSPYPKDGDFIRGKTPMTKEAVRRCSIEKLSIGDGAVCYDIGAGTGSLAIEMGLAVRGRQGNGQVYAIERDREALELIEANYKKFHGSWQGFHLVEGEAPEALEGLPVPSHALIGGSGGRLWEIVDWLLRANSQVRIVVNAITLETMSELLKLMKHYGFQIGEITQLWAAQADVIGEYHMLRGQNPVYIAVLQYPANSVEDVEWQDL